jgi:hypothetical protein
MAASGNRSRFFATKNERGIIIMTKTRLEKIADYDVQIEQIKNRQKQLRQQHIAQERKDRTRRLCSRHGLLEKMLPEIITITDEQYHAFLEKAVTNDYGRDILNKIITQTAATAPPPTAGPDAQSNDATVEKPTDTVRVNVTRSAEDGEIARREG